jgi:hypothetical protein
VLQDGELTIERVIQFSDLLHAVLALLSTFQMVKGDGNALDQVDHIVASMLLCALVRLQKCSDPPRGFVFIPCALPLNSGFTLVHHPLSFGSPLLSSSSVSDCLSRSLAI